MFVIDLSCYLTTPVKIVFVVIADGETREMKRSEIEVYTDGSALNNPGPGGWAFCYRHDDGHSPTSTTGYSERNDHDVIVKGASKNTTNNRMELQAVIECLKWIHDVPLVIHSDSRLTIKCAQGEWKRKANQDLWSEYDRVSLNRDVRFVWVKAHSGIKYNEIADKAARSEAERIR